MPVKPITVSVAELELQEKAKQEMSPQKKALLHEILLGIDELDAGLGVTLHSREEVKAYLNELARKAGVPVQPS